ncbi:MAG TPA: hypothetical protein VFD92_04755 [Candidatus Binatia bacterium]|nr:hypothetical protein [Candidatus Binatia bacterium]
MNETLLKIRVAREILEAEILGRVQRFQEEHGMRIESIELLRTQGFVPEEGRAVGVRLRVVL